MMQDPGAQDRDFICEMTQKILFRADASADIGAGHVMRCLTLANTLKANGYRCVFAARFMLESLGRLIEDAGHILVRLDGGSENVTDGEPVLSHAGWLGVAQEADADQCLLLRRSGQWSWIVVDHYAIDFRWEKRLRPFCDRLMVIDDLGDRVHDCDLLLDQNLGTGEQKYAGKVPANCRLLLGPGYALLRPEFAELRHYSLARRRTPQLQQLLITMGGVDRNNVTSDILEALKRSPLSPSCQITVVMSSQSQWLRGVRNLARSMPWPARVRVDVTDMALLMADSDLAIGAAGGSAWERCCLGLPSLTVILADNQRQSAHALSSRKAVIALDPNGPESLAESLPKALSALIGDGLEAMVERVSAVGIDGLGAVKVASEMAGVPPAR
ncbi:UDP-2,4-diacetamido-2,4,6-trideoxy-beta-L-altropyranose hydrolase [Rhizobium sp. BK077]|uniref:UDP-2,4-diacetamido-2,4, 6-trideoxy-beta-L-altropyranose hydrolase n=1 Tax=Rhizobium TaxID=379 RepID=UPI000A630C5D|nr:MULTISPECIES: UDP-2,4-diacetamido-2,4,6-trideoxy-beta-L-altropyranose hydrolase [Rhizobium]MBB3297575.1 UDP-2,4-diacetamido-2,4,6-trideoxy-beta-L-altropyranose hydrolase [Rhizobium sp. BK112]MBB3367028.1 UDP-2,4-diacetamido-2,4,6-trideoxy-beta-L-altropyranose hydrolase [Rhizobium sp. BK077]MBB4177930.1 UDP-2,4-diacetamido-2,4,6-trideoxy-beta-L-altropyranose hydrolase [Rhizobium sp. BK109]